MRSARLSSPIASWPTTVSAVRSGYACTARCRSTPGSGLALNSRWRSRAPSLTCMASKRTRLARAVGRARRSAVGTWTFADGGLVVEGGRRPGRDDCGPLLARLPFPASWRCVVAVPDSASGVSGGDEEAAFEALPAPSEQDVEHVAHLVLMALLPAVAEADIDAFGAALTQIQEITGRWFTAVQGGTFAPGASEALVRHMRDGGASGVGQSSWGPAVYGIVDGAEAGARLAGRVRAASDHPCTVYEGAFPTRGARVRWGQDQG